MSFAIINFNYSIAICYDFGITEYNLFDLELEIVLEIGVIESVLIDFLSDIIRPAFMRFELFVLNFLLLAYVI